MSKPYYNIGGTSQSEFIIRVGSDGIAKLRYVHDGVDEADLVFAAPDATSDKELQLFGGAWVTDFDDSDPTRGVRLGGAYLALESTDISMQLHSAQVGCRVVVAGLTERGNALLAVEAPPTPDYIANVTNSADVTIYSGGTLPSAWVNVCDLLTITQDIDADEATVFFELLVENTGTKDGVFEIGISLNGAAPTAANSIQYLLSAGIEQIFANTSINAAFLANGTTARLQARGISAQATGFSVVARNATRPSRLKVSVVGTGGGAIGANPTGTVGLTAVNGTALTWLRSDGAPPLSQAIVPTWSALHTFSLTPVVPNDSWTYAKIQNVSATSRVLGRITSGAGDIEELTGANLTTIIGGAALTKTDDTNVTLTLGGTPTTALLAATSLTLGWTGTLGVARGGTNIASYAVGDLLYASASATLSKLADIATGNALISGGVTTAPSWGKIGLTTHVSGTLPAGNGGTGVASLGNLTKVDDTNVTMTLGGTPTGALITSASMTLGWSGQLAVARGGSGAATLTGYLKGNGTSAFTAVATIPYTDLTGTPTIPAAANPSGLIGMSAVNGVATTWLRSDGLHAIDPAIVPTWSGAHTFNGAVNYTSLFKASGVEGLEGQVWASQGVGQPPTWRNAGSGSIDLTFKFNTTTAGTDPGNQAFALNSATYSAVTSISFDVLTIANFDTSTILSILASGNRIYIQQINDANRAAVFEVTGVATNNTGWWSVPVSFIKTTVAGTLYQSNANCTAVFILSSSSTTVASPTGTVGLTVVNGSASTAMRSDGAPPLSQAITPTWTNTHTFTASGSALASSAIAISSTLPVLYFKDTDAATDRKSFRLYNSSGTATLDFINDAETITRKAFAITLNNGVTAMEYGNATDNTTHTFLGTGLVAVNGQASVGDGAAATGDRLRLRNSTAVGVGTNYHHYFNIASATQLFLYAWDGASTNIGSFHIGHVQVFFADGSVTNPVVAFNSDNNNGLYFIGTDNWGASAGGAKVMEWLAAASGAAKVADTGGTMQPVGFRNVPVSSTTTTLAIGDVGKCIPISADINIPISVFAAGDIVSVYNDSGTNTRSITITAGGTLRKSGTTTTGPLTLAVRGMATLWFRSGAATPEVICSGDV
jgi:hypothetical protein